MPVDIRQSHAQAADNRLTLSSTAGRTSSVEARVLSSAIYVRTRRSHRQWYAEAVGLRIVGVGTTRPEALASLAKLLQAHARYSGGRATASRRLPRSERLKVRLLELISRPMPVSFRLAERLHF
jgi:hypothetical protein